MDVMVKGEWFFQRDNGPWVGPLQNAMTADGLAKFAELVGGLSAPFIAMGDAVGENYRKIVGAIIRDGAVLRLRISLSLSEGNGNHTYLAVYSNATATAESGTKINELAEVFSKNTNEVLNIECRFTMQQGVA